MTWWVEFADRPSGCVHMPEGQIQGLAQDPSKPLGSGNYYDPEKLKAWVWKRAEDLTGKKPIAVHNLPYGARPALDKGEDGDFCYTPNTCKGHGSCPKSRACSE